MSGEDEEARGRWGVVIHRFLRLGQGFYPRLSYCTGISVQNVKGGGTPDGVEYTKGSLTETTKTLPALLSLSLLT